MSSDMTAIAKLEPLRRHREPDPEDELAKALRHEEDQQKCHRQPEALGFRPYIPLF